MYSFRGNLSRLWDYIKTYKLRFITSLVLGVLTMALCGEIADNLAAKDGLGSFHKELFNQISRLDIETIKNKGRFYETSC